MFSLYLESEPGRMQKFIERVRKKDILQISQDGGRAETFFGDQHSRF